VVPNHEFGSGESPRKETGKRKRPECAVQTGLQQYREQRERDKDVQTDGKDLP